MASSCHGNDGCAMMMGMSGKSDGDIVDVHRIAVLQADAAAAGHAGADAAVAGVEDHGHLEFIHHFIERIRAAIAGEEFLQGRMELKAPHATVADEIARFVHCVLPTHGVDAGERRS